MAKVDKPNQSSSTLAKTPDGTVQITFSIAKEEIEKAKTNALEQASKDLEIPGFRKGKAPLDKVKNHVTNSNLVDKILRQLLPKIVSDLIVEHKIKPAIYPKFELLKAEDNENWELRATTCELPEIELSDYKLLIQGAFRALAIKREPTNEEKEQAVITTLLDTYKIDVPKILLDAEVEARLSALLSRLEKLGLTLEGYLASTNKTAQALREEYQVNAQQAIRLDLILEKIANLESISISDEEVTQALKLSNQSKSDVAPNKQGSEEEKMVAKSILRRRAALDALVKL